MPEVLAKDDLKVLIDMDRTLVVKNIGRENQSMILVPSGKGGGKRQAILDYAKNVYGIESVTIPLSHEFVPHLNTGLLVPRKDRPDTEKPWRFRERYGIGQVAIADVPINVIKNIQIDVIPRTLPPENETQNARMPRVTGTLDWPTVERRQEHLLNLFNAGGVIEAPRPPVTITPPPWVAVDRAKKELVEAWPGHRDVPRLTCFMETSYQDALNRRQVWTAPQTVVVPYGNGNYLQLHWEHANIPNAWSPASLWNTYYPDMTNYGAWKERLVFTAPQEFPQGSHPLGEVFKQIRQLQTRIPGRPGVLPISYQLVVSLSHFVYLLCKISRTLGKSWMTPVIHMTSFNDTVMFEWTFSGRSLYIFYSQEKIEYFLDGQEHPVNYPEYGPVLASVDLYDVWHWLWTGTVYQGPVDTTDFPLRPHIF